MATLTTSGYLHLPSYSRYPHYNNEENGAKPGCGYFVLLFKKHDIRRSIDSRHRYGILPYIRFVKRNKIKVDLSCDFRVEIHSPSYWANYPIQKLNDRQNKIAFQNFKFIPATSLGNYIFPKYVNIREYLELLGDRSF